MADAIERAEDDARELEPGERSREGSGSRGTDRQAAGAGPNGKPKKKDRTGLLVALSAAGVVIAYVTYRSIRGGSSASSTTAASTAPASSASNPNYYPASSGNVAGSGYNPDAGAGLETMIANLESQVGQLQTGISTIPTTPSSPSSGTVASSSPFQLKSGLNYLRDNTTGAIYQIEADGSSVHLTPQQWAEIKQVDPSVYSREGQYSSKAAPKPSTRARTISRPPVKLPVRPR